MTQITIDLDRLAFGGEEGTTLAQAIVAEAARRVLENDREIRQLVRDRVQRIADDEIRALFAPMLASAIENAVQPTNTWGEPKGEPTTLREAIVDRMRRYLTEPDPDFRSREPGGRRTRIDSFIAKEVDGAVKQELKGALDEAKAEVLAGVKEKASEVIAETLAKVALR